jgi:nicotinate-nucleotide--dimethylbenzimidazole phosphoribosyltransferase
MELLEKTLSRIGPVDHCCGELAQARLDSLTKPPGSLGELEKIAVRLAAVQGRPLPVLGAKVVMVMAGDHGVVAEGVSAFPQEVTPQMVMNFLNQGAAINVLSRLAEAKVVVTDVGVIGEPIRHPQLKMDKIRQGTRNMAREAAMTRHRGRNQAGERRDRPGRNPDRHRRNGNRQHHSQQRDSGGFQRG